MKVLIYPKDENLLRKSSSPVTKFGESTKTSIKVLKRTIYEHPAAGLAAPQVGIHKQIILVRTGMKEDDDYELSKPIVIVNPKVIEIGSLIRGYDACLSIPGLYGFTFRPQYLVVEGLDEKGNTFQRRFDGLDARVVHHEIDHLYGVLFLDHIKDREHDLFFIVEDRKSGDSYLVPFNAVLSNMKDNLASQYRLPTSVVHFG